MDAYHVQNESVNSNANYPFIDFIHKPVMIYYFVDPFCHHCWNLESYFKKMTMEYGPYFNVRPIIGHMFNDSSTRLLDKQDNHKVTNYNHLNKYHGLIGIKAAALQGNKAGRDFLRAVQDAIFLYNMRESIIDILIFAAKKTNLDIDEYNNDLISLAAKRAYDSDIQLMHEMGVNQYPTLVFFSQYIEDYSIKVSGTQSLAVAVRGIAVGNYGAEKRIRLILREITTGLLVGGACGIIIVFLIYFWKGNFFLGVLVGIAILATLTVATLSGALIPLIMERLNIDPAVASGPFITTLNDITSVLIYFGMATVFMSMLL